MKHNKQLSFFQDQLCFACIQWATTINNLWLKKYDAKVQDSVCGVFALDWLLMHLKQHGMD